MYASAVPCSLLTHFHFCILNLSPVVLIFVPCLGRGGGHSLVLVWRVGARPPRRWPTRRLACYQVRSPICEFMLAWCIAAQPCMSAYAVSPIVGFFPSSSFLFLILNLLLTQHTRKYKIQESTLVFWPRHRKKSPRSLSDKIRHNTSTPPSFWPC